MKKNILVLVVLALLLIMPEKVYAYDVNNYKSRSLCGTFEVAKFASNGTITKVNCYSKYEDARSYIKSNGAEDLVIMTKVSGQVKIIDANMALLDLSVNPTTLTYFYKDTTTTTSYTYMDTGSLYGGVDGGLLDVAYSSSKSKWMAKVRIGNFTGWIEQQAYEIVPVTWIKSKSSYTVTSTDIRHNYVAKIQNTYSGSSGRTIGPKPTMLSAGTYYSYDGHYFYNDIKKLMKDYKNNTYANSVNKSNPYYNYYMYLSNHTRTTYSSVNLDEYIRNSMGMKQQVYGNAAASGTSRLYGSGTFFYYAQEKYGVNALLSLSLSRNETANGTSSLSVLKNNGFGLNAVDSNPSQAANWYATFPSSILGYASKWITYGYAHPRDWRYFGPQFGDKWVGMNVKYASDTYWSEKMAGNYYGVDKALGLQDYNYYQLGVVKGATKAYSDASTSSKNVYTYPEAEDALVIVGEVTKNNVLWYKVVSDLNINSSFNEITSGNYNWNGYVYVQASSIKKINTAKNGYKNPNNVTKYANKSYEYNLYDQGQVFKPKVAITTKNTNYFYDSSLTSKTGKTLLKDKYVMVFAEAKLNNKAVAYLVTSDYWYDQREWVSADSLKFTNTSYGKVSVTASGNQYTWVNSKTTDTKATLISGLYTNSYVPILSSTTVSGQKWYKVPVSLTSNTNSIGYTLAKATNVSITLATPVVENTAPVINASDKTVTQGKTFNPLTGVTATDKEDGTITSKLVVSSNNVDTKTPGTYQVTYKVTDTAGVTTTKTIKVVVEKDQIPTINATNRTAFIGAIFSPTSGVTATDKEDGDITSKVKVTTNTVNMTKEGSYKITYQVTDSFGNKVEKTINVQVKKFDSTLTGFTKKESLYYFDYLKVVNNQLTIKGYNAIKGMNNTLSTELNFFIMYQDLNSGKTYYQPLTRITDKNQMSRPVYATDGKDYTYCWFTGSLDIDVLANGDYKLYVLTISDRYYSKSVISNKVLKEQAASYVKTNNVTTRNNYIDNDIPLELIVRKDKLGDKNASSTYNQYNQYRTLEFTNNKLHIKGTAYSYGMNLSSSAKVERKIIFEDTTSYKQYRYDLGSTTSGLYKVGTTLGDKLDKTRAWFDATIDISNLPVGKYAIYISNKANINDYGELNELLQRDVTKANATVNGKKYEFNVNKSKRYRIELTVK